MISLPRDADHVPMQLTPDVVSVARTYDATVSSATTITLNAATTYLEITAISKGLFMKYAANVTSSDFDEFIGADQTRAYVVPAGVTEISLLEEAATAKAVVIEK